jgi:nuclear transport factor 2 (NTF2) superfamily protein
MKLNKPILTTGVLALVSCTQAPDSSLSNDTENATSMETEQNKLTAFGHAYTKAWNSQVPEQVASFFAEDGSLIVNEEEPLQGRAAITEFTRGFMTAFPDMKLSMDSLVMTSSETEYHWRFIGTNTGPSGTGNAVDFVGFERWTFNKQGKTRLSIGSFDAAEYSRQVNGSVTE